MIDVGLIAMGIVLGGVVIVLIGVYCWAMYTFLKPLGRQDKRK